MQSQEITSPLFTTSCLIGFNCFCATAISELPFFVLSGFVIAHSLNGRTMSLPDIGVFMLKRSLRLDPPYWVAIAVAVSFSMLASLAVRDRTADEFSFGQIVAHIFYLQDILGYRQVNSAFFCAPWCEHVVFHQQPRER